ncbi:glycosyltransferase, partial [Enterococcus faecalis]
FFCYFLVPCVNEEKVIGETLKNLVALPIKKKIIAIDDGSTDQTKAMMDSIAGPIQVLSRQFPNAQQGKGAALNHAFQIVLTDA